MMTNHIHKPILQFTFLFHLIAGRVLHEFTILVDEIISHVGFKVIETVVTGIIYLLPIYVSLGGWITS